MVTLQKEVIMFSVRPVVFACWLNYEILSFLLTCPIISNGNDNRNGGYLILENQSKCLLRSDNLISHWIRLALDPPPHSGVLWDTYASCKVLKWPLPLSQKLTSTWFHHPFTDFFCQELVKRTHFHRNFFPMQTFHNLSYYCYIFWNFLKKCMEILLVYDDSYLYPLPW